MKDKLLKPSVFLFSEFVIIVLGVLVALAVDSWNESRRNDEIRAHLISSLLSDLREDKSDYKEFAFVSAVRARAAKVILALSEGESVDFAAEGMSFGEAMYTLGHTPRLETVESTFKEMTARGTGDSISDSMLRIEISHYYGLAHDRADINDRLSPGILRYRAALEELGISYVDREDIDANVVIDQPRILAIVRELRVMAEGAVLLAADMQLANETLTDKLQARID